MNTMEVFFHIGLPRTASTFLQYNVFAKFKNIEFIKKHSFEKRSNIINKSRFGKVLLTSEMDIAVENRYERLKKIASEYPNTKTILVLRKHSSWIKSKFFYNIRKHGSSDFNVFFNFEDSGEFKTMDLSFKKKIELIEKLFNNKPFILFHEEITKDAVSVINKITELLNIEIDLDGINLNKKNKSFSKHQLKVLLRFNKSLKNWPKDVKHLNFLYKSFRNLLIRLVVNFAFLIRSSTFKSDLISSEKLIEIDEYYADDWDYCMKYASKNNLV